MASTPAAAAAIAATAVMNSVARAGWNCGIRDHRRPSSVSRENGMLKMPTASKPQNTMRCSGRNRSRAPSAAERECDGSKHQRNGEGTRSGLIFDGHHLRAEYECAQREQGSDEHCDPACESKGCPNQIHPPNAERPKQPLFNREN